VPPSTVFIIVPISPTAKQVFTFKQMIDISSFVFGEVCEFHVEAFIVFRIVTDVPTGIHLFASTHDISFIVFVTPKVKDVQFVAPFVVLKTLPPSPPPKQVFALMQEIPFSGFAVPGV
jgi:hypothetical protein